jgi:hypothetical protein
VKSLLTTCVKAWEGLVNYGLPTYLSLVFSMEVLGLVLKVFPDFAATHDVFRVIELRVFSAKIVPLVCLTYWPIKWVLEKFFSRVQASGLTMWLRNAIPYLFIQNAIYAVVLHVKGNNLGHICLAICVYTVILLLVERKYAQFQANVSRRTHAAWIALSSCHIDLESLRALAYSTFAQPELVRASD